MRKLFWFVLVVLLVGGIFLILSLRNKKDEDYITRLNAGVVSNETQIIISNKDSIDYLNIKLTLNGQFNYAWRGFNLRAGESYAIWKVEFIDQYGRTFPQNQNPIKCSIFCDLWDGNKGAYIKKWK